MCGGRCGRGGLLHDRLFFFQAEDGIRDRNVTGVLTCALPISEASGDPKQREIVEQLRSGKQRLTKLELEVPKDLSEQAQKQRAAEKEKLSAEVEQLEG